MSDPRPTSAAVALASLPATLIAGVAALTVLGSWLGGEQMQVTLTEMLTAVTEILRSGEAGVAVGGLAVALPRGAQEIGLGLLMALILIFRPSGLAGGRELRWRFGVFGSRRDPVGLHPVGRGQS